MAGSTCVGVGDGRKRLGECAGLLDLRRERETESSEHRAERRV